MHSPDEAENTHLKQGTWRTYDAIHGLPWGIWYTLQDRRGYLWLGNAAGLHRYDGVEFISYTVVNGLPDNIVHVICEDFQGRLWIGTRGGVSCFDGECFTNYTINDGLADNRIRAIYADHKRQLWFGTENSGVSCFNGERFTNYTVNDGLVDDHVSAIHGDNKGQLWFGTEGGGVSCFDGRCFTSYTNKDGLADNDVQTIYKDHQGRLWFGTRNGVSCFNGERFTNYTVVNGLAGNYVQGICEDRQGRLWFGTRGGVSCFDGQRFINYTTRQGLLDNHVSSVIQDREGILWFSHFLSGLVCFDPETLHYLTDEPVTEILIQDTQDRLWFGNENKLCCLHEGKLRYRTFDADVFSFLEDSKGLLWVGTSGDGLYCYDSADAIWNDKGKRFTMKEGLASDTVLSLLETRDGTIWAGTANSGCLCRFNGETFEAIPTPHRSILQLFEDSQGRIWIGGGRIGGGLSYYDGQQFVTYTVKDGLPNDAMQSIVEDDAGYLWIGTQQGLCRFDGKQFTICGKEHGFFSPNYRCSAKDASGQLWFGTLQGGLYRTNGRHSQLLTTEDGLPSNGITELLPQPDGSMIIGTNRGIVQYHPTAVIPPQIEIREVIADRVYSRPEELQLTTTGADLLTISYRGLSFATRRMRYSYIMEGYDEEWQGTWGNQVRYEKLPVGEYTFKVIAINRDLVRSETPATLKLTVLADQWSKLRAEYEAEIKRMQKLLEFNRRVNNQNTLSDAGLALVEGLRELGFDRAGVWIRDTGNEYLRGLWGTDDDGNVYENAAEPHSLNSIPPSDGYYVAVDKSVLESKFGVSESGIYLAKDRDEEIFESIWGYPPPCPGYYQRDEHGDNICLCITVEGEKAVMIAVDNHITKRSIDETSANLLGLVVTEMSEVLANVALRESLAKSEARSRAILDAIPDLMFRITRDGVFLDYKAVSDSELYVPGKEIIGNNIRSIMPPEFAELTIHCIHKALDSGDIQFFEYQLPIPQGLRDYEARLVVSGENKVLAIVRDITERKQAEEQIRASLREKEVLLKEIHHRVKNNLQIISSLLNLQSGHIADEQIGRMFKESQSRVRSMALIHEKLYQSKDLARIDFADYIRDLADYLFRVYGANPYNIRLEINVDDVSLGIDTAIPCGLIINELVSNSLKYGFRSKKRPGGEIRIELRSDNDGKFTLVVSDNGVGFPKELDFRKTESLGLQLVNTLTDQLEGTIELDRNGGTVFKITFADPKYPSGLL